MLSSRKVGKIFRPRVLDGATSTPGVPRPRRGVRGTFAGHVYVDAFANTLEPGVRMFKRPVTGARVGEKRKKEVWSRKLPLGQLGRVCQFPGEFQPRRREPKIMAAQLFTGLPANFRQTLVYHEVEKHGVKWVRWAFVRGAKFDR